jgi:hypothetical protein
MNTMTNNISTVSDKLRAGELINDPHKCAEYHAILAGEYSWIMGQLEEILSRKPTMWNRLRSDVDSDKSAERLYEATTEGINEMGLKLRAKGIEKMMSALKSIMRNAENESRNLH